MWLRVWASPMRRCAAICCGTGSARTDHGSHLPHLQLVGTGWSTAGYGYRPYEYVNAGLAVDWWSLVKNEWVNTGAFGV